MNRDEIKKVLPHREPMLLLDEVALVDGTSVGKYTVRGDEFFLQGHFPGNPVVPGVILCEMMAQSACLLVENPEAPFTPYLTGMNNVKFKQKVLPGDVVTVQSEILKHKDIFYFVKCTAKTGEDTLCASGELSFALIKKEVG
ncbi:MAG: beta-hydroxyacyl-ACP dehydratase [Clostridiales bacterium]|jgi:3-hydroxyacyl-[acyl-carrier-protein] dehydratase|nr:beta-hydroxyacyl-ACP dehydratase [Clostridiales bacterium]